MKKIANFLFIISICLFLVACHHDGNDIIIQETGATPTHDFSVCNYLKDNAVFSQNQEFVISGVSENGVLIKVEIYNQDGSMILAASDIADNNGEFSVKLIAPKGSYNKHKIVINDSVHVHEYNNIFSLSEDEKLLFYILISITPKIEIYNDEFNDCININYIFKYIYKTLKFINKNNNLQV